MKGTQFYGKSPFKKRLSLRDTGYVDSNQRNINLNLNPKKSSGSDVKTGIMGAIDDISTGVDFLSKKHTLYGGKNKKLTLKGQVNKPEIQANWDFKDKSFSSFGSPDLSLKNRANLHGSYKIGKGTTLSGGVNWETGKRPKYNVGLKINI